MADEQEQIRRDVHLIIGGDFSADSIGLERFQATVARVREQPDAYLEIFDEVLKQLPAEIVINLRPAMLLDLLRDVAPERVRESARLLLERLEGAPVPQAMASPEPGQEVDPEEADRASVRKEQRTRELRALAEEP